MASNLHHHGGVQGLLLTSGNGLASGQNSSELLHLSSLASCLNDSEMRVWKIKVPTYFSFYFNLIIDFI